MQPFLHVKYSVKIFRFFFTKQTKISYLKVDLMFNMLTIQPPFRIFLDKFIGVFFSVGQALHVPDFRAICPPVFLKFPPLTRPPRVLWYFTGVQSHEALQQDRKCLLLGPCQTLRNSYSHGLHQQNGNENCSYVEIILTFEQFSFL